MNVSTTPPTPGVYSLRIEKAFEIPIQCAILAQVLGSQPEFQGSGQFFKRSKVVALADWDDIRIYEIFNSNTSKNLGWRVLGFGNESNVRSGMEGSLIKQGLELQVIDPIKETSLESLKNAYDQIYSALTLNWVSANIKDHPTIMFKKSDQFELFIKKKHSLAEEDCLINFTASKFSIEEDLLCYNQWRTFSGFQHGQLYLWIRRSALHKIVDKFGFKFQYKTNCFLENQNK